MIDLNKLKNEKIALNIPADRFLRAIEYIQDWAERQRKLEEMDIMVENNPLCKVIDLFLEGLPDELIDQLWMEVIYGDMPPEEWYNQPIWDYYVKRAEENGE